MTFTEAAAEVLRLVGKPLHYKEITDLAIEKNLLSHVGKSPEVTMGARLAAMMKKAGKENPLVRVKPGVFALKDWDDKTIASGATKAGDAEPAGADAAELAAEPPPEDEDEQPPATPDEKMRAEIVAAGAELFDEEDDDDQPIFGGDEPAAGAPDSAGGRRRRRRRRRRGAGDAPAAAPSSGGNGLPAYTETPVGERAPAVSAEPGEAPAPRESQPRAEAPHGDVTPLDDLAGRDLADVVYFLLGTFDRNGGPVSLRSLAEHAQRRGRVLGELPQVQSQIAASVRADNARRLAAGQRVRFRFAGGRVGLTDWALGGDLTRLEAEALAAVERYREASRRALLRKVQELPGHAFVELTLLLLDRLGVGHVRAVRRAGSAPTEAHFTAVQRTGFGEVRTAIVVRKDGREIGRERVADLRGSLHHYNAATAGWLVTAGQVLSGAREEAGAIGAAPVALYDGLGIARLCEENEVATVRARMPISLPDLDFLEALRGS